MTWGTVKNPVRAFTAKGRNGLLAPKQDAEPVRAFTAKGRNGLLAPKQDAETVSAFFEDMCSLLLVVSDGLLEIIDTRLR